MDDLGNSNSRPGTVPLATQLLKYAIKGPRDLGLRSALKGVMWSIPFEAS